MALVSNETAARKPSASGSATGKPGEDKPRHVPVKFQNIGGNTLPVPRAKEKKTKTGFLQVIKSNQQIRMALVS